VAHRKGCARAGTFTDMQRSNTTAILILGALFFIFGFVTWLNGPLISYLKIACELRSDDQPIYVAFAFYIAYAVTALPMSWVLERTGLKNGMMLGLFIMAAGALLFLPAAGSRSFPLFLVGLFTIGTGLSLLQTAVNPYVTVVGPIESAAARISIMGICNKAAGVLAPLAAGFLLMGDADVMEQEVKTLTGKALEVRLDEIAERLIVPYVVMTITLVLAGLLVRFSSLPSLPMDREERTKDHWTVLRHPQLVLGVVALFLYVGAEVIAGDTIGLYGSSMGLPLSETKHMTSYTLIAMIVGYVAGIALIPKYLSQSSALRASAALGVILTVAIVLTKGYLSVLCIALLGLANALVWPAIWPLAIEGLGSLTKTGSALLIMAIGGGALLPKLYTALAVAPSIGHQHAYLLLVPCYLFIGWYAMSGHRLRARRAD
jgi:MFS transporter, FHS family, L-fucose permease